MSINPTPNVASLTVTLKPRGYHLLLPVSYSPIDWTDVLPIIDRNRAAGVSILPPETRLRSIIDASVDGTISVCHTSMFAGYAYAWDANRLGTVVLSGETIARNYEAITDERYWVYDFSGYPESILSSSNGSAGYTWTEMGGWLDFPWNVSPATVDALFNSIAGFTTFVNTTLPGEV